MTIKVYEVGGALRDEFLGIPSKDLDFAVEAPSWEAMLEWAHDVLDIIWVETPEYVTVRGKLNGIPADLTLCRKEGSYSDHRHPDIVVPGTILEDLNRRDFTCNAIARDWETKEILDPHGGKADIAIKLLRCVGNPEDRFCEDPLRLLRAIRFCITKNFIPEYLILDTLQCPYIGPHNWIELLSTVSVERVRDELYKCLKHDTHGTLDFLETIHDDFKSLIFNNWGIWLIPTLKER